MTQQTFKTEIYGTFGCYFWQVTLLNKDTYPWTTCGGTITYRGAKSAIRRAAWEHLHPKNSRRERREVDVITLDARTDAERLREWQDTLNSTH